MESLTPGPELENKIGQTDTFTVSAQLPLSPQLQTDGPVALSDVTGASSRHVSARRAAASGCPLVSYIDLP
jgi:hypothetical protein